MLTREQVSVAAFSHPKLDGTIQFEGYDHAASIGISYVNGEAVQLMSFRDDNGGNLQAWSLTKEEKNKVKERILSMEDPGDFFNKVLELLRRDASEEY